MKTLKQSILAILIIGLITLIGLYFMHGSTNISMMDENVLNTVLGIFILVSLIACMGIYAINTGKDEEDELINYYINADITEIKAQLENEGVDVVEMKRNIKDYTTKLKNKYKP